MEEGCAKSPELIRAEKDASKFIPVFTTAIILIGAKLSWEAWKGMREQWKQKERGG